MPQDYSAGELAPPIIIAARHQNWARVEQLLEEQTDPNTVEKHAGWSVLHFVCYHGESPTAERLLRKGARTNLTNKAKQSPMALAQVESHSDLALLLPYIDM